MRAVRIVTAVTEHRVGTLVAARIGLSRIGIEVVNTAVEGDPAGCIHGDVTAVRTSRNKSPVPELGKGGVVTPRIELKIAAGRHADVTGVARTKRRNRDDPCRRVADRLEILCRPFPGRVTSVPELDKTRVGSVHRIRSAEKNAVLRRDSDVAIVAPARFPATVTEQGKTGVVVAVDVGHERRPLQAAKLQTTGALHRDVALGIGKAAPAAVTELDRGISAVDPESALGCIGCEELDVRPGTGGAEGDVPSECADGGEGAQGKPVRIGGEGSERVRTRVVDIRHPGIRIDVARGRLEFRIESRIDIVSVAEARLSPAVTDLGKVGRCRVRREPPRSEHTNAGRGFHEDVADAAVAGSVTPVIAETLGAAVADHGVTARGLPAHQENRSGIRDHIDGAAVPVTELARRIGIGVNVKPSVSDLREGAVAELAAAFEGNVTRRIHTDIARSGTRAVKRIGRVESVPTASISRNAAALRQRAVTLPTAMADHGEGLPSPPFEANLIGRSDVDTPALLSAGKSPSVTDHGVMIGRGGARSGLLNAIGIEVDVPVQRRHRDIAVVIPRRLDPAVADLTEPAHGDAAREADIPARGGHRDIAAESVVERIAEADRGIPAVVHRPEELTGAVKDIGRSNVLERKVPVIGSPRRSRQCRSGIVDPILPPRRITAVTDTGKVEVGGIVVERAGDAVAAAEVYPVTGSDIDASGLVAVDIVSPVPDLGAIETPLGAVVMVLILITGRIEHIDMRSVGDRAAITHHVAALEIDRTDCIDVDIP